MPTLINRRGSSVRRVSHRQRSLCVERLESRLLLASDTLHAHAAPPLAGPHAVDDIVIDARSDLSLAGRSESPNPAGRLLPVEIDLPAGISRWIEFDSVTGIVKAGPGWPEHGPDGGVLGPGGTVGTNVFSSNGISGIYSPQFLFLSGVFIADGEPEVGSEPERLDFFDIGLQFSELSPSLQQSFFIGDGLRDDGLQQRFHVPDEATRLFLGFLDAPRFGWPSGHEPFAYSDNTGELAAALTVGRATLPPTLDAIEDVVIDQGKSQVTVALSGITAGDGESQPLRVTATSSDPSLIPHPAVSYSSHDEFGSLIFQPVSTQSGTAIITVTVEDGGLDEDLGTPNDNMSFSRQFTVVVNPVNAPPTLAAIDDWSIDEDSGPHTVILTGITAGGGESQPLRVTATSSKPELIPNPLVDYLSPAETGSLIFAPAEDQFGTAVITVTVEDGGLDEDLDTTADNATFSRQFTVTVHPVNDPPTLDLLEDLILSENSGEQLLVLTGITAGGGESQPLRVSAQTDNRELITDLSVTYQSPDSTGRLHFVPAADRFGTALITVTVEDGGLDEDLSTPLDNARFSRHFMITVNRAPTANDLSIFAVTGQPLLVAPLENDFDPDGTLDPASIVITEPPASGTVVVHLDGTLTYTPSPEFRGQDVIGYTVSDNHGQASETARITVDVADPLVAEDFLSGTHRVEPIEVDLTATLVSAGGIHAPLSIEIITPPLNGNLSILDDGMLRYQADEDFVGSDTFTHRLVDARGRMSNIATVTVQVVGSVAQNPVDFFDVSGNGEVTPLDALLILTRISQARRDGFTALTAEMVAGDAGPRRFYDVDGSGVIEPIDALRVLLAISRRNAAAAGGESESVLDIEPLARDVAEARRDRDIDLDEWRLPESSSLF